MCREQLFGRVVGRRSGPVDERVVITDPADLRRGRRGFLHPVARDRDVQFGEQDLAGLRVLDAIEEHAGDAERRRHHAAHVAGVQAGSDDVDRERARHQTPQRRGHPQAVVVDTARVETDDEARRADAIGERLDVRRQIA